MDPPDFEVAYSASNVAPPKTLARIDITPWVRLVLINDKEGAYL